MAVAQTASDDSIGRLEEIKIRARQMAGADKVGGLAIGIVVVAIVLNEMYALELVSNSSGVIDVQGILQTAGSGLSLLTLAIIAIAATVILSVYRSGF